MPNTKQAKKRMRQDDQKRLGNKAVRSSMRTAEKKVVKADSTDKAQEALPEAMKRIDKAAKKRVIHPNAAARRKSRLARQAAAKS